MLQREPRSGRANTVGSFLNRGSGEPRSLPEHNQGQSQYSRINSAPRSAFHSVGEDSISRLRNFRFAAGPWQRPFEGDRFGGLVGALHGSSNRLMTRESSCSGRPAPSHTLRIWCGRPVEAAPGCTVPYIELAFHFDPAADRVNLRMCRRKEWKLLGYQWLLACKRLKREPASNSGGG